MQNQIEALYHAYSDDVYRYLLSLCRSPAVAEDLLQSTFLRVMTGIAGFRGGSAIKTWIFSIARHEFYHWLRKNPVQTHLEEDAPAGGDFTSDLEQREQTRCIMEYIRAQDEPHRSLLVLRLVNGHSFKEIGEVLGKTENWARVTFLRDKRKLLETLKEDLA